MENKKLMSATLAAVVALGISAFPEDAEAAKKGMEHCYGVVKAGFNDCGAKSHGCAGQGKVDSSDQEWIYLAKGTCDKLVNGSTEAPKK